MPLLERLYDKERAGDITLDFFVYSTSFASMATAANTTNSISIQADSDFVIRYINVTATVAGQYVISNPPLLISFYDTGSGRNLQDNPILVQNLCGGSFSPGGSLPGILPEPKLIVASSSIQVTINNISNYLLTRCDVALVGFKVFYNRR